MTHININTIDKRQALLSKRTEELEHGWEIQLPDASQTLGEPFKVRIRKIQFGEKAAYMGLSNDMAEQVYQRTRDYARMASEHVKDGEINQFDAIEMLMKPEFEDVINLTCLAAFIDPPLVATPAEQLANPLAWLLTDFTFGDRLHVFHTLQNPQSKEAKAMTRFRPEPVADVGPGGTEQQAESAA